MICTVLDCYIVLQNPAKIELRHIGCEDSGMLELRQSRIATELQPVEADTLIWIET